MQYNNYLQFDCIKITQSKKRGERGPDSKKYGKARRRDWAVPLAARRRARHGSAGHRPGSVSNAVSIQAPDEFTHCLSDAVVTRSRSSNSTSSDDMDRKFSTDLRRGIGGTIIDDNNVEKLLTFQQWHNGM